MTAPLNIRDIRDDEHQAVAAMWDRCGLTRPWNDALADIGFVLSSPASAILVGENEDGTLCASAVVGHDGHRGTVYYVSVDPEYRGHGHGRQIMLAAEEWLRGKGIWKLNLMIRGDNADVEAFYHALGYEVEHRTVMARWIDPSKNPVGKVAD